MNLEVKDVTAIMAVIIAVATLWNTIQNRRDRATKDLIDKSGQAYIALLEKFKADFDMRLASANARAAELTAQQSQIRLELVQHQAKAITRADMDSILETALDPVLLHMKKSETFMEEILRAGLLTRR